MRVAIIGGRSFGKAVLDRLRVDGHSIVAVWTRPGDKLADGTVPNLTSWESCVGVGRDDLAREPSALDRLVALEVDILVSAHNHVFVTGGMRRATRLGCLGYHPSLLPRHRGKDAVRWTIHMGDPIAGGSTYWLDEGADTGPIALQDWCHVRPDDDASSLWQRELFPMGVELISKTLHLCEVRGADPWPGEPQDEALATWEPSWDHEPLAVQR